MLTVESRPGATVADGLLLYAEDDAVFLDRLAALEAYLQPRNVLERMVVHYIAVCSWRIARMIFLETAVLDWQVEESGFGSRLPEDSHPATAVAIAHRALADNSRCLDLMGRTEARAFAAFENALKLFHRIRNGFAAQSETNTPERNGR
jgi:hypothetical protein